MNTDKLHRRYEFDWLRILAVLTVFFYHSTRFFNLSDWHVKNIDTYVWVEGWIVFASIWLMPLFFVISGASLFYAIGSARDGLKFYSSKFLRLMIPVLFASITHSALQVYLERLTHGRFSGSFLSFIPEYFSGLYLGIGMPGNFAFHGMHLWYLLFLFLYTMIFYRLFIWFMGNGHKVLNRIISLFSVPGSMYLGFSIPLVVMKAIIPGAVLSPGNGGWGFLYYIWFLIAGFMIVSNDRFQQQIQSQRRLSLYLGVVFSAAYIIQRFGLSRMVLPVGVEDWVTSLLCFISAWSWLFAFLGFGMRHLAFNRPILRDANEGVLPFFILHQTVLLAVGYFIMATNLHDILKWMLAVVISIVIIMAFYLLFIRKYELLRFFFGMKTTRPFFSLFRGKSALATLHALFVLLIVFSAVNPYPTGNRSRSPMPLTFDPGQDIVLDCEAITERSSTGVQVVAEEDASIGQAIEFQSGANQHVEPRPLVYVEMKFSAPAGRYTVWLRGKSDMDNGYTDSIWLQVDDQIGSRRGIRLGNWLDIHPAGVYGWASDMDDPVAIELRRAGEHRIRIQPRQTPHKIDQILLSRLQLRIPDTNQPIR